MSWFLLILYRLFVEKKRIGSAVGRDFPRLGCVACNGLGAGQRADGGGVDPAPAEDEPAPEDPAGDDRDHQRRGHGQLHRHRDQPWTGRRQGRDGLRPRFPGSPGPDTRRDPPRLSGAAGWRTGDRSPGDGDQPRGRPAGELPSRRKGRAVRSEASLQPRASVPPRSF